MRKPFWKSKTFWAVILATIIIITQWVQGTTWIPPGYQGVIGTVIALLLRFVTDQGVSIPGLTTKE